MIQLWVVRASWLVEIDGCRDIEANSYELEDTISFIFLGIRRNKCK